MTNNRLISSKEHSQKCSVCGRIKPYDQFYSSKSKMHIATGRVPVCKVCLKNNLYLMNGSIDKEALFDSLRAIDKPYIHNLWEKSLSTSADPLASYMASLSRGAFCDYTWADSKFEDDPENESDINRQFVVTDAMKRRWGVGFNVAQYEGFETKYDLLKDSLPEQSTLHTEAYLNYCKYQVLSDMAAAAGNVNEAKQYGELASKAAAAAKITPASLAMESSGETSFGEIACAVEQRLNWIEMMPQFLEKPRDKLDVAIEIIVNSLRKAEGKSEVEYKEIYDFYKRRCREYFGDGGVMNGENKS